MYLALDEAYLLCSRVAGVGIVLSSAEGLTRLREFRTGGVYDPVVVAVGVDSNAGPVRRALSYRSEPYAAALAIRLVAGFALALGLGGLDSLAVLWSLAAITTVFLRWRHRFGGDDGSDQMLTIMSVTFALSLLLESGSRVREIGLFFIGAQACLAYATSGVAKLLGSEWRRGVAVQAVLLTRTYGVKRLAIFVGRYTPLGMAWCWATMVFETAFVVAPMLPTTPLLILLAVAAAFHMCAAAVMGLNGFFWAFVSTYPAVVFLNQVVRGLL